MSNECTREEREEIVEKTVYKSFPLVICTLQKYIYIYVKRGERM